MHTLCPCPIHNPLDNHRWFNIKPFLLKCQTVNTYCTSAVAMIKESRPFHTHVLQTLNQERAGFCNYTCSSYSCLSPQHGTEIRILLSELFTLFSMLLNWCDIKMRVYVCFRVTTNGNVRVHLVTENIPISKALLSMRIILHYNKLACIW